VGSTPIGRFFYFLTVWARRSRRVGAAFYVAFLVSWRRFERKKVAAFGRKKDDAATR